ncbi:hypothetical protein FRB95_003884 [Tulasnella sp. JGI-2019a]|nr:hypothetical protein FRB95_003884 [Tulasnella sp. JGI-2019a]
MAPNDPQEESLTRRLAGQSVNKAGLALDQTEINRVIAEASKGSKFYENERKKDAELTTKIGNLLLKKEELAKGIDTAAVESSVDRMISEIEATRDLSQTIVHIDCDAFFASVEELYDPSLKGKAFGVSPGVLTTASYEARKYGCRSAMPTFIAKKLCPHLIVVPIHFDRYNEMSGKVFDVLRTRDPNMAPVSSDESYLNITEYMQDHNITAEECVKELRAEVEEKTKLTVSAGIAPNKMLAKVCSDRNKPNGQFMLPFDKDSIMEFTRDLPIRKIPGIGKVTERLLDGFGIKTCGDIYTHRATIYIMDHELGLGSLLHACLGIGSNDVQPGKREERKSVGAETTFHGTSNVDRLLEKLEGVAESLADDLERTGFAGKTITLKYKLDTYQLFTRAKSCSRWITSKEDLFEIGKELFLKELPLKLRLIGLRATNLKDLRVSDDKGIMKFFKPGDSPPGKRRKTEDECIMISDEDEKPEPELPTLSIHASSSSKPNFFGSDDSADDLPVAKPSVKPRSYAGPSSSSIIPRIQIKPASSNSASRASMKRSPEPSEDPTDAVQSTSLDCPICGKTLKTDNAGLNEHVDFCLSRGMIKQASAEGGSTVEKVVRRGADSTSTSKGKGKGKAGVKRANPFVKR